jgi:hypothetical protein
MEEEKSASVYVWLMANIPCSFLLCVCFCHFSLFVSIFSFLFLYIGPFLDVSPYEWSSIPSKFLFSVSCFIYHHFVLYINGHGMETCQKPMSSIQARGV